jgi:hypothetical protein
MRRLQRRVSLDEYAPLQDAAIARIGWRRKGLPVIDKGSMSDEARARARAFWRTSAGMAKRSKSDGRGREGKSARQAMTAGAACQV